MMKHTLAITLILTACLQAGTVNLVNLSQRAATQFTLSVSDRQDSFQLSPGSFSGKFVLDGEAKLSNRESKESLTIPFSEKPQLAIYLESSDTPRWVLMPSKPTEGSMSLRVLNLHSESVMLEVGGTEIELQSGAIHSVPDLAGRRIPISIPDKGVKSQFQPDEACAGFAIIFKEKDSFQIVVIPDI